MKTILKAIQNAGGHGYLVGGYVRDCLIPGSEPKDIDIEVFGLDAEDLINVLTPYGKVDQVGRSFGVIKLTDHDGQDFDFSLPRRDNKVGEGHRGFEVQVDHGMTLEEAAKRRDFTINAISYDLLGNRFIDPFGGREDLNRKILRHTSHHFSEDPLRVLRGMQFCGRFDLHPTIELVEECHKIIPCFNELAKERVWEEWKKLLTKSVKPSKGLRFLQDTGWLTNFPELDDLIGVTQDREWHPEGDVWNHTLHVVDAAAEITNGSDIVVMLAALCHDLGKPSTTGLNKKGRISAHGHDLAGVEPTKKFLERIGCPESLFLPVSTLVREHMVHISLGKNPSRKALNKLKHRLQEGRVTIQQLSNVIEADHSGRPPLPKRMPEAVQDMIQDLSCLPEFIEPLIMGRDLIELGWKPGKEMGDKLRELFKAQLNDKFRTKEDGIKKFLKKRNIQ